MFNLVRNYFRPSFISSLETLVFNDHFVSFSINKDDFEETDRNRIIKTAGMKGRTIALGLKDKIVASVDGKDCHFEESGFASFNRFVDRYFEHIVESSIVLLRPGSELTSNLEDENRALEWLRTSFKVLAESFLKISKSSDLIYQGRVFFGQKDHTVLRIQSLSLDILLDFLPDHRLRVRVWNYRDGQKTSEDNPDLFAEFVTLKGPVFDEIISLLSEMRAVVVI